jgi:hypothetical protein
MPVLTPPAMANLTSGFTSEKSAGIDPVNSAELGTPSNEKSEYDSGILVLGDSEIQDGVAKVEAIASVWSKKELYIAYIGYVFHLYGRPDSECGADDYGQESF